MADSRRSAPAERRAVVGDRVSIAVTEALQRVPRGARVAVALSGGRDSVALLDALARNAAPLDLRLLAIHVHHGLSRHADAWAAFCARITDALGIELETRHVSIASPDARGIEAAARHARYAAIADVARERHVAAVLLAQHQDDQAETLLLQLGRGAGPHGLAAMPAVLRDASGLLWLRPLLDVPRADIEAYVRDRALAYVDDDSNASAKHRRNALRGDVVPQLARVFPGYPETFARAASHQAEAARLVDELAAIDAGSCFDGRTLACAGLAALAPHRARNVLRWFLRRAGLRPPSTSRLDAMLAQLAAPRVDARVRFVHDGAEIGVFRGRIVVHATAPAPYVRMWHGEAELALPHGRLAFEPTLGEGASADKLSGNAVTVRPREGGERLQLRADRPRRALKSWLQEARLPEWERRALPLVFCGETLAVVPGLGVDVAFQARPGEQSYRIAWQPDVRAASSGLGR